MAHAYQDGDYEERNVDAELEYRYAAAGVKMHCAQNQGFERLEMELDWILQNRKTESKLRRNG